MQVLKRSVKSLVNFLGSMGVLPLGKLPTKLVLFRVELPVLRNKASELAKTFNCRIPSFNSPVAHRIQWPAERPFHALHLSPFNYLG